MPLAITLGAVAFLALVAAGISSDLLFSIHIGLVAILALGAAAWQMRSIDFSEAAAIPLAGRRPVSSSYMDDVIRAGVIATVFWGVAGFLVGVVTALQLAFPVLNLDLPWTTFGRLRPLHTSAVIFAFGGNAS